MEDLRWILLLVGGLVIVAVYFSSRFEREDWVREREQFDARKQSAKKGLKKQISKKAVSGQALGGQKSTRQESSPVTPKPRKEPQMTDLGSDAGSVKDSGSSTKSNMPTSNVSDPVVDTTVVVDATSSTTELSSVASNATEGAEKNIPEESESTTKPEATSEATQNLSSASGKTIFESRDPDGQTEIVMPSGSEIPTEVLLDEKLNEEPGDVPVKVAMTKDDVIDEEDILNLSLSAGIEDEIVGVEIPADLAIAEAELHTTRLESLHKESQQSDAQELDSEEMALPPNVDPLVLVLTVMAEDEPFAGPAVQEALEMEGLRHGEMRIFHCFDESLINNGEDEPDDTLASNEKDELPIFSVASLVEPGYFELDKIHEMEMPGLTLFCQLPGPLSGPQSGEEAFEIMLDKGRGVAVRLHGQLCDDKRNVFTTQAKTHYLDRIATFTRELNVARIKAGV